VIVAHDVPTPDDLVNYPELAALDVLDRTLFVAEHALLAAHPVLMTEHPPDDRDEAAHLAHRILGLAVVLAEDLARYRATACPLRGRPM
jgi:hypothetical protein